MSSPPPFDPYEVLGVPLDADDQAIKKAHRRIVISCHPDKVQDERLRARAADTYHKIQRSYEILVDPVERRRYHKQLELAELKTTLAQSASHKSGRSRIDSETRQAPLEARRAASSYKKSWSAPFSHTMTKRDDGRTSVQRASTSNYDNQRKTQRDQTLHSQIDVHEGPRAPIEDPPGIIPNAPNLPRWYSCGACYECFTSDSSLRSHLCWQFRCPYTGCVKSFGNLTAREHHLKVCEAKPWHNILPAQQFVNEGRKSSPSDRPYRSLPTPPPHSEITRMASKPEHRTFSEPWPQAKAKKRTTTIPSHPISDPLSYMLHTTSHASPRPLPVIRVRGSYDEGLIVAGQVQLNGLENIECTEARNEGLANEGQERVESRALSSIEHTPTQTTASQTPLPSDGPFRYRGSGKRSEYLSPKPTATSTLHEQGKGVEANFASEPQNVRLSPANTLKASTNIQNAVALGKQQRAATGPAMPNSIFSEEGVSCGKIESWEDFTKTVLKECLEGLTDREARDSILSAISTPKIDAADTKSFTALHHAAGNGIGSAVVWLLRKGADIHSVTNTGYEPLHVAIDRAQLSTTRILLERGADFNGRGRLKGVSDVITPIELAVSKNNVSLVRMLLLQVRRSRLINEQYALRWAAEYADFDIVQLLLEHGADPNSSNNDGCGNSLHGACKKGRTEVVRLLLEYKTNADAKAFYDSVVTYRTAMYIAQREGHARVVAQLQLSGVELSPDIPSEDPRRPIRTLRARMQINDKLDHITESVQSSGQPEKTGLSKSQCSGARTIAKAESTTLLTKRTNVGTDSDLKASMVDPIQRSELQSELDTIFRPHRANGGARASTREKVAHNSHSRKRSGRAPREVINADVACGVEFVGSKSSSTTPLCLPLILKAQKATGSKIHPAETVEISESSLSGSDQSDGDEFNMMPWKMQELIEKIMTDFYSLFLPRLPQNSVGQTSCAHGSGSGGSSAHAQSRIAPAPPSQRDGSFVGKSLLKRSINDREWPNGDSEDEDRKRPKPLPAARGEEPDARKFACPFFKFDPKVFSKYGSCTGPGFKSVSRVKEHLYRRHQPPLRCPRCWSVMQDNQGLEDHLRLASQCELQSRPPFLGISPRKLELLKSKKRQPSDQGEEGKWRDVYRVLFPGADIPCPYYEPPTRASDASSGSEGLETFQEFARVQLPLLVEAKYESRIQQRLDPLEEEFKRGLGETVRTALTELFKTWQEKSPRGTPPSSGAHSRTSSNRSTERTSSGFMSMGTKMDELSSVFHETAPPEPPVPQFPLEQNLDNAYQSHRVSDSGDSDYSFLVYEPYPCICNSAYGVPSLPRFDDGFSTSNAQASYNAYDFTSMTGGVDMGFVQAPGPGHDEMLDHSKGKGKARQEDVVDHSPQFCGVCGGVL